MDFDFGTLPDLPPVADDLYTSDYQFDRALDELDQEMSKNPQNLFYNVSIKQFF